MQNAESLSNDALHPKRPSDPTKLLLEPDIPELWQARNFKANRFSVVNLDLVIGDIALEHTTSKKYFNKAADAIIEAGWNDLYRFSYSCSHTQIYPQNRSQPRQFGHAATAIVALELAAADLRPGYNVYDKLRILPATYFVDLFDREQLERARRNQDNFEAACLAAIGHEFDRGLVYQHCVGMTLTKSVANKLLGYLETSFPDVKLGPVRCVGDPQQRARSLGTKNQATELTVTTTIKDIPDI